MVLLGGPYEVVRERGHRVVCLPRYRPQYGPVEYAICVNLVKRWSEIKDLETMKTIVEEIIDQDIHSMDETFLHCSYIWN